MPSRKRSAAAAASAESATEAPAARSHSGGSGDNGVASPNVLRRSSLSSGSLRSLCKNNAERPSRLHLMSATGFTQEEEMSVFQRVFRFVRLPRFTEYLMSVDHHQIWRRHLAWSLRDGDHLRNAVTSRFASNMVFMSLLLGTEIGVLFSPSKPADTFRAALKGESYGDPNFWAGIILCISIGLTLSTLVANFTAWAIISAVAPHNSHAILRSSVGLAAAQLPARLVITSIYCFLAWVMIFLYILLPHVWGLVIAIFPVALIAYIVVLYSSFGRLVIYSRAMRQKEIFKGEEDYQMSPRRLFEELLKLAEKEKEKQSPLPLYYRSKTELSNALMKMRSQESEECVNNGFDSTHASQHVRNILSSSGPYDDPLPMLDELLSREEMENGAVPQSNENEGGDTLSSMGSFRSSSSSVPDAGFGSSGRLQRSGSRRGHSAPESARRGSMQSRGSMSSRGSMLSGRFRGESTRSLMNNNSPGATMTLTL